MPPAHVRRTHAPRNLSAAFLFQFCFQRLGVMARALTYLQVPMHAVENAAKRTSKGAASHPCVRARGCERERERERASESARKRASENARERARESARVRARESVRERAVFHAGTAAVAYVSAHSQPRAFSAELGKVLLRGESAAKEARLARTHARAHAHTHERTRAHVFSWIGAACSSTGQSFSLSRTARNPNKTPSAQAWCSCAIFPYASRAPHRTLDICRIGSE